MYFNMRIDLMIKSDFVSEHNHQYQILLMNNKYTYGFISKCCLEHLHSAQTVRKHSVHRVTEKLLEYIYMR